MKFLSSFDNPNPRFSDHPRLASADRFFARFCLIYLFVLALLLVLSIILAWSVALIGLIRTALVMLLFLALLLLPISLLLRRWRLAVLLVIPFLALIVIHAPFFTLRSQSPAEDGLVLEVLTFNIHKPNDREASEELAAIIRQADADIVALQELGPNPEENFSPLLANQYPYQAIYIDEHYLGSGQAILSKYPILAEEYWKAGGPWNGNLRAELEIEGGHVVVYNIHPHPPIERGLNPEMNSHANTQRDNLDRASTDEGAVLLVGDFNMTAQFEPYRWITVTYTDAHRAVGNVSFGFTHPHFEGFPIPPFWRIDYVFYDDHFRGLESHTLPRSASTDHLPVMARVQLIDP